MRADFRAGQICAALGNAFGGRRSGKPAAPWDFFGSLEAMRPPPQTAEEIDRAIELWQGGV